MTTATTVALLPRIKAAIAGLLLLLALAAPAAAALRIDITRGKVEPVPVAIPNLLGETAPDAQLGADIARVVTADLERSGLFQAIPARAFIQKIESIETEPRFADWRVINAQALVTGKAALVAGGQIRIQFRLWDVFAQQQMVGKEFTTTRDNWRRIAHIIADEIYRRVTGEAGYFDTRVVYVAESGPANRRVKRIAIMDQDGENHRFLTDGQNLVLTPRFSPTAQEITYLAYVGDRPRVYILNVETGRQEVLGDFPGMTFAPRYSPDGSRVVMSLARGGDIEIHSLDLKTRQVRQLTNSPGIDTSPSYAPDGRQIVFNSDRGGSQQLYVMDAEGGGVRRISFGKGRYATPVWSPRGDLIAFTKIDGGQFFIGVMRPDGSGERLLTQSYLVEGPTWAPNGRVLMYFRQDPPQGAGAVPTRVYSIDLTGYNERLVVTPSDASDPAWSPLIP